MKKKYIPEITQKNLLDMQVCVPKNWKDNQVVEFANAENQCGTTIGWLIRKQGDRALCGAKERVTCTERKDFIHIMLDA